MLLVFLSFLASKIDHSDLSEAEQVVVVVAKYSTKQSDGLQETANDQDDFDAVLGLPTFQPRNLPSLQRFC